MSIEQQKSGESEAQMSMRLSVIQKVMELMMAAFSLVAALAWNDAVQSLFQRLFPQNGGVGAKFVYALFVTAIVVWVIIRLSRVTKAIEKRSKKLTNA